MCAALVGACSRTSVNEAQNSDGSPVVLSPVAYTSWISNPENGLRKSKTIGEITYETQYKPYEYIVNMEAKGAELPDSVIRSLCNELSDMVYFDFRISAEQSGELLKYQVRTPGQYYERVNYCAFGMQRNLVLQQGSDTIPCGLFHFERAYDAVPYANFQLGFSNKYLKKDQPVTLIYEDMLFGQGLVKFTFTPRELNIVPKISTL